MNIAIVGATGNVGRKLLEVIEKLNFEFSELYLIASDKSVGKKITFKKIVGIAMIKKEYWDKKTTFELSIGDKTYKGSLCDLPIS